MCGLFSANPVSAFTWTNCGMMTRNGCPAFARPYSLALPANTWGDAGHQQAMLARRHRYQRRHARSITPSGDTPAPGVPVEHRVTDVQQRSCHREIVHVGWHRHHRVDEARAPSTPMYAFMPKKNWFRTRGGNPMADARWSGCMVREGEARAPIASTCEPRRTIRPRDPGTGFNGSSTVVARSSRSGKCRKRTTVVASGMPVVSRSEPPCAWQTGMSREASPTALSACTNPCYRR